MSIAETIRDQIRTIDPMAFGAWGTTNLTNMGDGLKFKTTGMVKWKGYVYVKYDYGADLYNVIFAKIRKGEWKVEKQVDQVFCEDLVNVIDQKVG